MEKAIAFQFARVGNDRDAKKFLEHLDNKSPVKDYVDTLSGGDLMEIMGMRTKDQALTEKHQRRVCDTTQCTQSIPLNTLSD